MFDDQDEYQETFIHWSFVAAKQYQVLGGIVFCRWIYITVLNASSFFLISFVPLQQFCGTNSSINSSKLHVQMAQVWSLISDFFRWPHSRDILGRIAWSGLATFTNEQVSLVRPHVRKNRKKKWRRERKVQNCVNQKYKWMFPFAHACRKKIHCWLLLRWKQWEYRQN